jgi:opacity protein-like surface antigen
MRINLFTTAVVAALLAAPVPAAAQWQVTPAAGLTVGARTGHFDPDDVAEQSKMVIGLAIAKTWGRFGVEADAAAVPGFFSGDGDAIITSSRVTTVTGNFVARLPGLGRLRPYAVAGVGAVHVRMRDVADVFPTSEWQMVFDAGAGVMVPAGRRISVGADARYFRSQRAEPGESAVGFGNTFVDFWRVTARVSITVR